MIKSTLPILRLEKSVSRWIANKWTGYNLSCVKKKKTTTHRLYFFHRLHRYLIFIHREVEIGLRVNLGLYVNERSFPVLMVMDSMLSIFYASLPKIPVMKSQPAGPAPRICLE